MFLIFREHGREVRRERIQNLEREHREIAIRLSKNKSEMQKAAEILSANINRTIVDTISAHRL